MYKQGRAIRNKKGEIIKLLIYKVQIYQMQELIQIENGLGTQE